MCHIKIGNVNLKNPYILAPMAGVTDLPFRLLCKEQGASLVCTEMISAKGLIYNNKNTESLLDICERERPVSLQIFGSDPKIMSEAAKRIEDRPFDILDINMGCPVPKVVRNNEGCALMKDPKLVYDIVSAVVKTVKKPVTVKIRSGFDASSVNAPEIARIAQEAGASAVTVHARTREQFYSGTADWRVIRRVKEAVSIPVIGSGDMMSAKKAMEMLDDTRCDAVMAARGALGNPWIFSEFLEYERTGMPPPRPSLDEMKQMMLRHARMQIEYSGVYSGVRKMRKHISWYVTGLRGASKLREKVNKIATYEDLENVLTSLK